MTWLTLNPRRHRSPSRLRLRPGLEPLEGRQLLTAGLLDTGFGTGGKVALTQPDGGGYVTARALLMYPATDAADAGKFLAAGVIDQPNLTATRQNFCLYRFLPDGRVDTTFGINGSVVTDFNGSDDFGYSVAFDASGRILVGGSAGTVVSSTSTTTVTRTDFALARYTADGRPDTDPVTGFGPLLASGLRAGKVTTPFGAGSSIGRAVAVQPDGQILLAGQGYSTAANTSDFAVARYNPDGTLDPTFGAGGVVDTVILAGNDYARGMVLQPDGKIVVGGDASNGTDRDLALARYNADGSPDATFGAGGVVTTAVGAAGPSGSAAPDDYGVSPVLDASGRVVMTGYTTTSTGATDSVLVRYTPAGALDTTFGGTGKVVTDLGGNDQGRALAVQPGDGKIVMVGNATSSTTGLDVAVARLNSDGTLDTTFGIGGKVTSDYSSGPIYADDYGIAVALQADGKIVAGGAAGSGLALARYLGDTSAQATAAAPAAPANFTARAVSYSQINLAWTDPGGTATGYYVERSTDGTNFTQIAKVVGSTQFSNTGLKARTTYYYRIRAYNASGNSGYTIYLGVTTLKR